MFHVIEHLWGQRLCEPSLGPTRAREAHGKLYKQQLFIFKDKKDSTSYYVQSKVLSTSIIFYLILIIRKEMGFVHFTAGETEAQRGKVTYLVSHSPQKPGLKLGGT